MADKIRLGIIGANIHRGWAIRSHLPAVVAGPEFELTAVCTTRMESAEESRQAFGAKLAFDDYNAMLAHPKIDAAVVCLRVPSHYEPTLATLNAGKHIYTEWPLGRTTAEAQEMADLARAKGVRNIVGLQSRANPAMLYLKDLVASGYVGEVMSCHVSRIAEGTLERPSDRTWQRDRELGANTLTISCGHTIDALRFVVGDFSHVSSGSGEYPGRPVARTPYNVGQMYYEFGRGIREGDGCQPDFEGGTIPTGWWKSPHRTISWSAAGLPAGEWHRSTSPAIPGLNWASQAAATAAVRKSTAAKVPW